MNTDKLKNFILSIGGELLKETNPYEVARFIIKGETGVIYKGKKGISFSNKLAEQVFFNFENGKNTYMGEKKKRVCYSNTRDLLIKKYGKICFYTLEEMQDDEISLEHLIPLSKGGLNNVDNMVLCKKEINQGMGNKSLIEKIEFREETLKKKWLKEKQKNVLENTTLWEFIKIKYLKK